MNIHANILLCIHVLVLLLYRGVAALHSLNEHVVHRDIKSFNFLVDDQLNAKLADLELGFDDNDATKSKQDNEALFQADFLFNWLAPEVLQSTIYTQASDIYSLSLVLWEIMSGEFPFSGAGVGSEDQAVGSMREQIIGGKRPDFTVNGIPICCAAYEQIVTSAWSMEPCMRPSAVSLVACLDRIWQSSGNSRLEVLQDSRHISSLLSSYLLHNASAVDGQGRLESSVARDQEGDSSTLFKPFTDNASSNNTAEEVMASYEHLAPLRDLYLAINSDAIWKIARSSTEPLIIISGQTPHIVMLMSTKFESLTGLRQKSCFGICFEDLVTSPKNVVDKEGSNQKVLSDFYVSLKLNKSAHMVLNFLTTSSEELTMSIHAMPIYSKDSLENGKMANGETPPSLTMDALSTIRDMKEVDFSHDCMNEDKDPVYYVLDMNYLERIQKDNDFLDNSPPFLRNYSTTSLSSKISGLFKSRGPMSPSRHMSMQNHNSRSSSFTVNRNSEVSSMMRTSYSSGNLGSLRDSFIAKESAISSDLV
jgi:hypothetical protein